MIVKKSYGVIVARYNETNNKIEYLLVKRRTTFSYSDFILKHYNNHNDVKLLQLFNEMSHEEKLDILSGDFNRMWYRLFMINPDKNTNPQHLEKYILCKSYFEKKFMSDNGVKLKELICKSSCLDYIWEIPKGRKSFSQEKDLTCAMRELEEETNFSSSNYIILNDETIKTTTISCGVKYINHYFLAISTQKKNTNIKISYNINQQLSEVSRISWLDIDNINVVDQTRKLYNLLKHINNIMNKKYKIRKIYRLNLLDDLK